MNDAVTVITCPPKRVTKPGKTRKVPTAMPKPKPARRPR